MWKVLKILLVLLRIKSALGGDRFFSSIFVPVNNAKVRFVCHAAFDFSKWTADNPVNPAWASLLPPCPASLNTDSQGNPVCGSQWTSPSRADSSYHPFGAWEIRQLKIFKTKLLSSMPPCRSPPPITLQSGQQCIYDSALNLMKFDNATGQEIGAGTPDRFSPNKWAPWTTAAHVKHDACPWEWARKIDSELNTDEGVHGEEDAIERRRFMLRK